MIRTEFPLLRREFVAALRTSRAFWLLVTAVVVSALLPLIPWPSGGGGHHSAARARGVFSVFAFTQLTAALLIVPALTAASIAGEREKKTYELLYTTLLRPSSIILSKLFSAIAYLILLLIATLPIVSVLSLLGGVTVQDILIAYGITLVAVVKSSVVCLAVSMRYDQVATSAMRCVLSVLLWNVVMGFVLVLLFGFIGKAFSINTAGTVVPILVMTSPYSVLASVVGGAWYPRIDAFTVYVIYAAVVSAGHFVYLLLRIRLPELARAPRRERKEARKRQRTAKKIRRTLLTRILLRSERPGMPIIGNPVFLKEIRAEFFGRSLHRHAFFLIPLVLFVLFFQAVGWQEVEIIVAVIYFAFALVVLFVPSILATSIPREAEQGNLDFLRGTLVPFRSILTGKIWASIYAVSGIPLAAAVAIGAAIVIGGHGALTTHPETIIGRAVTSTIVLVQGLAFSVAVAAFFTARAKRSLTALLGTYGTLLASFLGVPVLVSLAVMSGYGFGEDTVIFMASTTPFVALGICLSGNVDHAVGVAVLLCVWYGTATGLLWFAAVNRFEKERVRDL